LNILLDENMPIKLRAMLPGHDVSTVQYMGWKGTKNGDLLLKAQAAGFDGLITRDKSMPYENNIPGFRLRVVILVLLGADDPAAIQSMQGAMPEVARVLSSMKPGEVRRITPQES